ncbi:MAG: alpha/beta fold hydrolase [Chlorobiaceae bacterium]|nr:alpha/beta fold hydrolase [Chlorobiaceae bacterium]
MNENGNRKLSGVLILHGFTANLESIRELFSPLDRFGLNVVAPLLRGHGTPSPDQLRGVTWQDWLDDAESILKSTTGQAGKVVVIGHSMGALLALQLAARHPEMVDSIILATPPLKLASLLAPGRPLHFLAPVVSRLVDRWDLTTRFADPRNSVMPKHYEWAPTAAIMSFFDLVSETRQLMASIVAPTLILHARNESIVLPESADIVLHGISTPTDKKAILWLDKTDHQIFCDCERKEAIKASVEFISGRIQVSEASGMV